ncbi:Lrp/AsnC family transcriptional regulator [Aquincola sp. S2]|uniref:Lrp/AsnC family transcriptional regulator n=1 Tax=Pseudaquabacterium terrae TaxID=2732868 RepID=A0ABX2EAJ1_9BURK|nr:Lrp/AsnC family transcriptional regulator [Aquabacterium terrae]NRF66111.1 Lrp/AsnC family transcriptional regulator [Aquabacterium terrae]
MDESTVLDALDTRILRVLQADGRTTYDALAAQIGLSASATLRRVRRLEETGVIAGYVALVPPERIGLALTVYINVRLEKHTESHKRNPMDAFKASVQTWPEVVECAALSGEMDYLLRVVVRDMTHYSRFIMDTLLKHPSVQDCKSSFMLERIKGTGAMPL